MIYLSGDTHGDVTRFSNSKWDKGKKGDYLIILGDFGLFWDDSNYERHWLKWLDSKPWTTLFIDGNHENFNVLDSFPEIKGKFGKNSYLGDTGYKNIFHVKRGSVLEIGGKTFFCFGGAESIDRYLRKENITYWKNEIPRCSDIERGIESLKAYSNNIDFILTHTIFKDAIDIFLDKDRGKLNDPTSKILSEFYRLTSFTHWYFGHFHKNKTSDYFGVTCLYDNIINIGG